MSNIAVFTVSLNQKLTVDLSEFTDTEELPTITQVFGLYKDQFPFEVQGFRKTGCLEKLTGDESIEAGANYKVIPANTGDKA